MYIMSLCHCTLYMFDAQPSRYKDVAGVVSSAPKTSYSAHVVKPSLTSWNAGTGRVGLISLELRVTTCKVEAIAQLLACGFGKYGNACLTH